MKISPRISLTPLKFTLIAGHAQTQCRCWCWCASGCWMPTLSKGLPCLPVPKQAPSEPAAPYWQPACENPIQLIGRTRNAAHKIFDLGAFTILPDTYRLVFSQRVMGGDATKHALLELHGYPLIQPQSADYLPAGQFLAWHCKEVFKRPQREVRDTGMHQHGTG